MPRKAKNTRVKLTNQTDNQNVTANALNRLRSYPLIKNKKVVAASVLVIIIVSILLYFYKGLFVAALVNGEPISRISVITGLEKQSGRAVLDNLITKKLILQEARKRNVSVTSAEIDGEIKKIEASLKEQGTTLDQALSLQGMSRKQLNEEIKIQLSIQKMVGSNAALSDKEIENYITQNKDLFPEGSTEEEMKKQAKESLEQQKISEKTQNFLADLQKKAKILNFVSY